MSETPQPPRAVWRRVAPPKAPAPAAGGVPDFFSADRDRMRTCGEEGVSDAEFMKSLAKAEEEQTERARAYWAEQERLRKEEEEARQKEKKREADEDDDVKVAERYRNDRYSVKLLRQENTAWGGNGDDSGMLG
ncbi:hypothetical protein [Actinoplanes xinjiangensis]|uniref:Uncharacterized protein n=1 Tax=Actinoplanes xinjiangensis TaxID=512350 RepID=A0A316F6F9_9ACTN|nr:hypothetical protein [Actinoplanes xinjiangensis]PWK32428.1 hypothetical protein BC793_13038 [Actinoplanes xinjiangensis]GIF44567.1 hypothetical protein Axi01nite_88780 [Actinoplanes xinjiangensis]